MVNRSRSRFSATFSLIVLAGMSSGCCSWLCGDHDAAMPIAHVPPESGRVEFQVPPAGEAIDEWVDKVVIETTALLRSGEIACCGCSDRPGECRVLDDQAVRASLEGLLRAMPQTHFPSASLVSGQLRRIDVRLLATTSVMDSRRKYNCNTWGADCPGCMAALAPIAEGLGVWAYISIGEDGLADTIVLYPSAWPCDEVEGG